MLDRLRVQFLKQYVTVVLDVKFKIFLFILTSLKFKLIDLLYCKPYHKDANQRTDYGNVRKAMYS